MKKISAVILVLLAGVTSSCMTATAQERGAVYKPSAENIAARHWFQDAKFGIFIHWGVYSLMAGAGEKDVAEWVMEEKQIPIDKYERLATFFNPVKFDADKWVQDIKASGAKYITITSKHHDGFAMYDSKVSNYNIAKRTPFKRDILKELKAACDKAGIKLFFYYSQLDWHHPEYYPRGRTGNVYTGRPQSGDWDSYIDYQNAQLRELLTNYGEIGGIWFDGWWDQEDGPMKDRWRLTETYKMIHDLQPQALIINNHHVAPYPGEDVQPFEQDLPGENDAGFNTTFVSNEMPLEMAQTMNGSWGFNLVDDRFKSTKELISALVGAAGRNSNYLMNTGPMPDGQIQAENIKTFHEMGEWLKIYGESIYGTRGGPIGPRPWGVTTNKDKTIYIHILDWKDGEIFIPLTDIKIGDATLLGKDEKILYEMTDDGVIFKIDREALQNWDMIIKVNLL
ncbi:MAG: alpha-L-fucosidase [Alphaproteobacteria bacterium]|nr:alpha-L-fucosidase [Alphaproteobacteria bacterium]